MRHAFLLGVTLILVACSGGGSSSSPSSTSTNSNTTTTPPASTPSTTPSVPPPPQPSLGEQTALIQTVVPSPLSTPLMDCLVELKVGACTFENVPLIGMETASPTIDDVMARVIVSHEWMGVRFREILERMPPDILLLMRGLTGVVISYDIRPSFYTSQTGAMYLDPDRMWLTEDERAVIETTPDFRGEFAKKLDFIMLWRYVDNNTDIRSLSRSLDSISLRTAALLFHELAHANDFFPAASQRSLNRNINMAALASPTPSIRLANTLPLGSNVMRGLAQISFNANDVAATPAQAALTAEDIAVEFPSDNANDYYNYSTSFEDLAMAFEEAMMYVNYGISRDVAVTNFPDSNSCRDYVVAWGQRNRIADPAVQARSVLAVETLLPERAVAVEDALANMPAPSLMTAGANWCDNINLTSTQTGLTLPGKAADTVEIVRPYH